MPRHASVATTITQVAKLDALARELRLTGRERALAEGLASAEPGTPRWKIAQAAGYRGSRTTLDARVSRGARKDKIQRYMAALAEAAETTLSTRTRRAILDRQQVLRRLSAQARADIGRHLERDERGGFAINANLEPHGFRLDPEATCTVRGVEIHEETRVEGEAEVTRRRVKLRVGADPGAVAALVALAEMYGMRRGGAAPRDDPERTRMDVERARWNAIEHIPGAIEALERVSLEMTERMLQRRAIEAEVRRA